MMKKKMVVLVWICILCLLCVSCGGKDTKDPDKENGGSSTVSGQDQDPDSEKEDDSDTPGTLPSQDDKTADGETGNGKTDSSQIANGGSEGEGSDEDGEEIEMSAQGKKRITYTGRRSSVIYVTSADSLPDYEELKQYDEEYFKEHALLLVTETVNSGSIDVSIQSVRVGRSAGTVTLSRVAPDPKDAAVTNDMATWLLWAEVDKGLDCQWSVANPAMKSNTETY